MSAAPAGPPAGRPTTMLRVNGYEVEEAPNGAWWVRPPHGRRAWRFATHTAARAFGERRRPAAAAPAPGAAALERGA